MSTPVTMPMSRDVFQNSQSTDFRDVGGYVAAVRAQLDDLGRDEIEELTDGLEADLTDALGNQELLPVAMFGAPDRVACSQWAQPTRSGRQATSCRASSSQRTRMQMGRLTL